MSIKLKLQKQRNVDVKRNLHGQLLVAVKDANNNVYKQELQKVLINGEYKINTILNIPVLTRNKISNKDIMDILKDKIVFKNNYNHKQKKNVPVQMTLINKNNIDVKLLNNNTKWQFEFDFSTTRQQRSIDAIKNDDGTPFRFKGTYSQLEQKINNYIAHEFNFLPDYETLKLTNPIQLLDLNNMPLNFHYLRENDNIDYYIEKKRKYADIINLFNEKVVAIENPVTKNCVIYFFEELKKNRREGVYTQILKELYVVEKKNRTIFLNDLIKVLTDKEITIYLYSSRCLEFSQTSDKYNKTSHASNIILYITDNHIYRIYSTNHSNHLTRKTNTIYDKMPINYNDVIQKDTLLSSTVLSLEFDKATDNSKLLLVDKKNNTMITNNNQVSVITNFINSLGLDKKLLNCSTLNFISKIKFLYKITNYSIFPYEIKNDVLLYKNNSIKQLDHDNLINFDFKKCFSSALCDIPFVPMFNILSDVVRKYEENENIIDHYLYFIEIQEPNNIYNYNGCRSGYYINKFGGLKYITIKYTIECRIYKDDEGQIFNPYKNMINKLYELVQTPEQEQYIKESINAYIGQMLRPEPKSITAKKNIKHDTKNDMILQYIPTKEQIDNFNKYNYDIDTGNKLNNISIENLSYEDKLNLFTLRNDLHCIQDSNNEDIFLNWENETFLNAEMGQDNKPLNILIRDIAQGYILELMDKIKTYDEEALDINDIIELNTDSLYITNAKKYNIESLQVKKEDDWTGLKIEKGYKKTQIKNKDNYIKNVELIPEQYFYEINNNIYNFNIEYAGGGKTYRIKELIKKELEKNPNYSYIILSPLHDFLIEYRKNNLNCSTIAHYTYNKFSIKETNIYVDECFICGVDVYLYLMRHENKIFHFYGDDKQLEPVNSNLLNKKFIETIAHSYNEKWTNKRNTFTKEYYDTLINEKNLKNIDKVLYEFNYPIEKSEIIIGYYNDTIDKYNKMMLMKNNQFYEKNNISVNIPIINITNGLKLINAITKEQEIIYNRHSFKIDKKINDNEYIISDTLNKYIVSSDILLQSFKVGYCITLYASQGKTFNTIHFIKDDIRALIKKGALYTLISRLRFKDESEYKINVFEQNLKQDLLNCEREDAEFKILKDNF